MNCTREYVAICVDTEGALTSKNRRKDVRQRKESLHWKRNTAFQRSMLVVRCHVNDDGLWAIFFAN